MGKKSVGTRLSNEPEDFKGTRVEGPVIELTLDQLRVDEGRNLRKFPVSAVNIRELADSIKSQGLINPVIVFPVEANGDSATHQLDSGYQRVKALRLLAEEGEKVPIRATVISGPSEGINLAENLRRSDLTAMDKAYILKEKVDAGMKKGDAGKFLGLSGSSVTRLLSLTTLRPEIQDKIHKGLIPERVLRVLPDLSEKKQDELLADVEKEGSSTAVKKAAKAKKSAGRKGKQGRKKSGVDTEELYAAVDSQVESVKSKDKKLVAADHKALELYACLKGFLNGTMSMKVLHSRVLKLVAPR